MQQKNILILSGILGIAIFLILPGWSKIFSFLIPGITLSYVFTKKFDWIVFLSLSLLFILFPSSYFTLDVTTSLNTTIFTNYVENIVKILITIFAFVIPILGLIGAVYAFTLGNVDQGVNGLIKVIATILIASVLLFFGSLLGWELFSLETVKPLYDWLWTTVKNIANFFTQTIPDVFGFDPDSDLAMLEDIELFSVIDSPKTLTLTIGSIYPLIISIITFGLGLILAICNHEIKINSEKEEHRFNRPNSKDFSFLIFLIIELICAFVLYLTYDLESFLNYQNLGFFSIYLLITAVTSILMFLGVGSATKNSVQTIYGIIIGVALLFLFANMFTQVRTLDLMNLEYPSLSSIKILNQFLFVAPTESQLLHVFLPSLVIYYYLIQNRVLSKEELDAQIRFISFEIENSNDIATAQKQTGNMKAYAAKIKEINNKKLKKYKLENIQPGIDSEKLTTQNFVVYLVYCLGFNILFSILHWFKSGLGFFIFWSSGIGFLYLSAGMILTLVSYKFGWLSGVLTHAIYNTISLYLAILMGS